MRLITLSLLLTISLSAQQVGPALVLEDFASRRVNLDSPPVNLFSLYTGEDSQQVDRGFAGGAWTITGDTSSGTSGCYTGCGLYWQMLPYPYQGSTGWMSGWVKSGTFSSSMNRMSLKVKCDGAVPRNSGGQGTLDIGTYVKPHSNTDPRNQGQHYYHQMDFNVYANHWLLVEINQQPQHRVGGDPNVSVPFDPEWAAPSMGGQTHYFDGLTRFYFDTQPAGSGGRAWAGNTCQVKDVQLRQVANEPEALVASVTGQHNGAQFEVSWATPPNSSQVYSVVYSRSALHPSGLASGTAAGTVTATGNAYKGVFWQSPALPLAGGLYVGIQPQGSATFTEVFIPPMDSGGAPPPPLPPPILPPPPPASGCPTLTATAPLAYNTTTCIISCPFCVMTDTNGNIGVAGMLSVK